ncbi:reverse transcriptase N-terminal domain-containing protein [Nostoc mirabile]|uniref:reverse transcriptase N-terminal domain-containing protein n=1 Tax=Nostoc mirabile TaxID=2907820 RepID=UPI001E54D446|nr:reverse transcriptase N-terminal domain-containing protein [Nostoc mirabile]
MMSEMTTNGLKKQLENWNQINWKKVNKAVRNLRQRIFRARKLGDFRKLRNLQKLIQKSYANLLLSVRRITQTNQGKATAGIDKEIVNTPEQRVILVKTWNGGNLKPTRRVEIPKPNGKKRPLGIPTVRDRIEQAIVKNSLAL